MLLFDIFLLPFCNYLGQELQGLVCRSRLFACLGEKCEVWVCVFVRVCCSCVVGIVVGLWWRCLGAFVGSFEGLFEGLWRNKKAEFLGQFQKKLPYIPGEKSLWSCGFMPPPTTKQNLYFAVCLAVNACCNLPPPMVI